MASITEDQEFDAWADEYWAKEGGRPWMEELNSHWWRLARAAWDAGRQMELRVHADGEECTADEDACPRAHFSIPNPALTASLAEARTGRQQNAQELDRVNASLADSRRVAEQMAGALRAVVDNRHLCFIPEQDCPRELLDWTEKARAALAAYDGGKP